MHRYSNNMLRTRTPMVPGHPHTLCSDLSQLYGFSHIYRNTRVSWESRGREREKEKITMGKIWSEFVCVLHSLQHQPVSVVNQRQTPNSFEPLWHSPNACDSPRFSAFAADLVGVSPLLRPKSESKNQNKKSRNQKSIRIDIKMAFIRPYSNGQMLPALAIAA